MFTLQALQRAFGDLDGQRIRTQQRKAAFTVRVFAEGPEYIPESTGEPRPDSWTSIQKVLDRYNETGSLRPADYHDLTFHSSYVLAVLIHLVGAPPVPISTQAQIVEPSKRPTRSEPASPEPAPKPHQRVGSVSNAHVGADFERVAQEYFAGLGIILNRQFPVDVGLQQKKLRHFDLGSADAKILVECKSHTWTEGGRVPSAKMTVWNEAMYYFLLAPPEYRKVLFVLHDRRHSAGETLLAYYKRTYSHMIPDGVEFLEWDGTTGDIVSID